MWQTTGVIVVMRMAAAMLVYVVRRYSTGLVSLVASSVQCWDGLQNSFMAKICGLCLGSLVILSCTLWVVCLFQYNHIYWLWSQIAKNVGIMSIYLKISYDAACSQTPETVGGQSGHAVPPSQSGYGPLQSDSLAINFEFDIIRKNVYTVINWFSGKLVKLLPVVVRF